MQQRASIVRSLSFDPSLLLMDEPFGALDAFTRDEMNLLLQEIWLETGKTIVFITHNIAEAVFLADRVMVMSPRPGRLQRVFEIDLPRPRPLEFTTQPHFIELVARDQGARSTTAPARTPDRSSRWRGSAWPSASCRTRIPTFEQPAHAGEGEVDITNLSALTAALGGIRTWAEIGAIVLFAVLVVGGTELLLRVLRGAALHHADPVPDRRRADPRLPPDRAAHRRDADRAARGLRDRRRRSASCSPR